MSLEEFTRWDNHGSDPIADMQKAFAAIRYGRFICKKCAWYRMWTEFPVRPNFIICRECGESDFHYSQEPF